MEKIFITATNTDIGKTYTTLKLIEHFSQQGKKVGAIKPIETGVKDIPLDGEKLLLKQQKHNKDLKDITIGDVVPITFALPAAPYIASDQTSIDLQPIKEAIQKFEPLCDILLIEGAGGLFVPINKEYYMIDLIKDLAVDTTLLVTHCDLGCINDTLLSFNTLKQYNLKTKVIFNCKNGKESFEHISKPYFNAIGFKKDLFDPTFF